MNNQCNHENQVLLLPILTQIIEANSEIALQTLTFGKGTVKVDDLLQFLDSGVIDKMQKVDELLFSLGKDPVYYTLLQDVLVDNINSSSSKRVYK